MATLKVPAKCNSDHRAVPDNGHTLLLIETVHEKRTFSEYPNLPTCLESLYEEYRIANNQVKDNYVIDDLYKWLDNFRKIEVFVFDKEISRYKQETRDGLKRLFIEQIEKLSESSDEGEDWEKR